MVAPLEAIWRKVLISSTHGVEMKKGLSSFLIVASAALTLAGTPAFATVLTFEELPHADELQGTGDIIFSKEYTLTYTPAPAEPYPVGFQTVGPSWRFNGRSSAINANSCSAVTKLTAPDNAPFSLVSMDLAELNGDGAASVVIVGITRTGAQVEKKIRLNGRAGWERFYFPLTFKNLRSVSWEQGDCITNNPHMFDNIRAFSGIEK